MDKANIKHTPNVEISEQGVIYCDGEICEPYSVCHMCPQSLIVRVIANKIKIRLRNEECNK